MYCANCGQPLPPNAGFCHACGTRAQMAVWPPKDVLPVRRPDKPRKSGAWLAVSLLALVLLVLAGLLWADVLPNPFTLGNTQDSTQEPHETSDQQPATSASTRKPTTIPSQTSLMTTGSAGSSVNLTSQEILDYFAEVALKREYGGGEFDGVACRWEQAVKVEIAGEYSQEDYDWLTSHIRWLNSLGCLPLISVVSSGGNFQVYFTELSQLPDVIPSYVEGNWGFISLNWNIDGQVTNATMGIATDVTNQTQRNHLILEEFTQGLGLLNDSPLFEDSIFQIEWTEIQVLSPLDELLIRMLYAPVLKAGMKEEVLDKLEPWLATQGY